MFEDRTDAGRQLAAKLGHLKDEDAVVLALPRGGVPVGYEVAKALDAPLDILLVRKIGAPFHPELAAGAVVDGTHPVTVVNEDVLAAYGIDESWIAEEGRRQLREIERRRKVYGTGRAPVPVAGRTAVVVDDGIATGATTRAALRALRQQGVGRLVLATPVVPPDTLEDLRRECDEAVAVLVPRWMGGVGACYRNFRQLDDAEVVAILDRAATEQAERARQA